MVTAQTIVVRTSGTDPATLILAALGVALALASLVWQARTFVLSGSRILVEVQPALRGAFGGHDGVATLPATAKPEDVALMHSQGFTEPVVAVRVNNLGRGATSIAAVDLLLEDGGALSTSLPDPALPFRLIGESEQTWYIEFSFVLAYLRGAAAAGATPPTTLRGRVRLGTRKTVVSQNLIPIPPESALAPPAS